jgi:hypothetical protein
MSRGVGAGGGLRCALPEAVAGAAAALGAEGDEPVVGRKEKRSITAAV